MQCHVNMIIISKFSTYDSNLLHKQSKMCNKLAVLWDKVILEAQTTVYFDKQYTQLVSQ